MRLRVFDFAAMEQMLGKDPAAGLRALADTIERDGCRVRLLNAMPIGGRGAMDTIRLMLDVDVQLVQITSANRQG